MSRCKTEDKSDEMFPPAGIPEFQLEHDYPTRFSNFHWWGQPVNDKVCYKSIRRDELPIPPLLDDRWRYPYRYSSAGPSRSGLGRREREKKLQLESLKPKKKIPMQPREIRQVKGYETISMDASLDPFLYHAPTEIVTKDIPPSILTPTWAPKCAHTDFGQYVLNQLHPNYKKDPRTRTRIQFSSRDSNRELCVTKLELEHLDPRPQKKIKKKDFLFVQQRPGHRPTTDMPDTCRACE